MDKKQYLNEENYQKNKKKIKTAGILVLIIGLLIGGGLITTGLVKYNEAQLNSEEISSIQTEIDGYNTQLASLKSQQNQEFRSNGLSENYYILDSQIDKIEDKIDILEESLEADTSYLVVFYMFGGFIIVGTLMISGVIFTTANRREINAFYVQQQMPIVKEGIEKMAPTAGVAAKEITKGIKEGLKDDEE